MSKLDLLEQDWKVSYPNGSSLAIYGIYAEGWMAASNRFAAPSPPAKDGMSEMSSKLGEACRLLLNEFATRVQDGELESVDYAREVLADYETLAAYEGTHSPPFSITPRSNS